MKSIESISIWSNVFKNSGCLEISIPNKSISKVIQIPYRTSAKIVKPVWWESYRQLSIPSRSNGFTFIKKTYGISSFIARFQRR